MGRSKEKKTLNKNKDLRNFDNGYPEFTLISTDIESINPSFPNAVYPYLN